MRVHIGYLTYSAYESNTKDTKIIRKKGRIDRLNYVFYNRVRPLAETPLIRFQALWSCHVRPAVHVMFIRPCSYNN